uniref:SJCHGC07765 protein n=1 Tax=Schistosoma japonicum TaxID=6182 RepID=Q5BRN7_SCHJA|nr:SJCHGC07765 protein [Schistosoma japonicum]
MPTQVIDKGLVSCRATSNPAVPEGKSPAEFMFGRKVRTIFNSILPSKRTDEPKDERQRTTIRSFQVSENVLIKSYQGIRNWDPCIVERRIGKYYT